MKKSNFVAMILGTIGGILGAIGMCMALIPTWNAFVPGIFMGSVGLVVLLITLVVWRKMENKAPIHINGKSKTGEQRYLCHNKACHTKTFRLEYRYEGSKPGIDKKIIDMATNGSGIRDTSRVLKITTDKVMSTLKKLKN